MKRNILVVIFCLLCMEMINKVILLSPLITKDRLGTSESAWRIRWVHRYLESHFEKEIYHPFDVYDRTKGWALKPNLDHFRSFGDKLITSNSKGIRSDREYSYAKDEAIKRALMIGASFVFGAEVSDHETYPYYFQQALGRQWEVLNFGVHGYGLDQMLLQLREEGLKYHPDIVILGFHHENMHRNILAFKDYAKPKFVLRNGTLELTNVPVPTIKSILLSEVLRIHSFDVFNILWNNVLERTGKRDRERAVITESLLNEMKNIVEQAGAKWVILQIPPKGDLFLADQITPSETFIEDYCKRTGTLLVNPRAFLREDLKNKRPVNIKGHYDPTMNEALASYLYDSLKVLLLSPASGGTG